VAELDITVRTLTGAEIADALDDLAALRIEVFRAFPYLYDGDIGYERDYIAEFSAARHAALVAAFDGDRIVGAATASPMSAQKAEFQHPFIERRIDIDRLFYFGESVLLSSYRGKGIGHAFFEQREAAGRAAGASQASFCVVIRTKDHPARPADYQPLDAFWRKRGYAPVEGFITDFDWKEIGGEDEVAHQMQYWIGAL
jgi:GNAT superfamily N-acetyltransferase